MYILKQLYYVKASRTWYCPVLICKILISYVIYKITLVVEAILKLYLYSWLQASQFLFYQEY